MQAYDFNRVLYASFFLGIILINFILLFYLIGRQSSTFIENNSSKLFLKIRPRLSQGIGVFIGGWGVFLLAATILMPSVIELNCNRLTPEISQCGLFEFNLLGSEVYQKQFSGLKAVELETVTNTDSEGHKTSEYQLMLLTDTFKIRFRTSGYSKSQYSLNKVQPLISSINYFLANSLQKHLIVLDNDTDAAYGVIGLSILLGLLALFIVAAGTIIDCNFDKETNSFTLSRYQWFGKVGKDVIQHSLNDIKNVKLEQGEGQDGWVYRVTFVLSSGKIIPLTRIYSSSYGNKQELIERIKTFLYSGSQNVDNDSCVG